MRNLFLIILFATFPCTVFSGNIVITGKISNPKEKTVVLTIKDIIKDRTIKTVQVNKFGEFRFEYEQKYAHDNNLQIDNKLYTIFVAPDDTLHIEVNDNKLSFTGRNSQINNEIQHMPPLVLAYPFNTIFPPHNMLDYKSLDTKQHKQKAFEEQKKYLEKLKEYNETQNTSSGFREWAYSSAKFMTIDGLMNTMAIRQYYGKNIPVDFYDFLKDTDVIKMNSIPLLSHQENADYKDNPFVSSSANDFAEQYLNYLIRKNKPENSRRLTKKQSMKIALETVAENSNGKLREAMVTKIFYLMIKAKEMELVKLYLPFLNQYVIHTEMRELIINESKQLQNLIDHAKIPDHAILKNFASDALLKDLIETIVGLNKGKVIYVDVWATWCGPCLAQMPYSKKLQESYTNKAVSFVYLCYPTTDKIWNTTIADIGIGGQHYLLSKDQYNLLADKLQLTGVPHYALINKDGIVVDNNAPNPNSEEVFRKINKLLE